ncbi:oxidoreductase [Thermaurantimonas aggregans]|uniref:Oxidoreductase n=1 Tax=Thermaurantimonas aggregans TaxID=2173829 RepID=A0A401XJI1_9FLAO|nr:SDR family NAD(P)-dependent oxidoreductase [Thermaurantimonas aggregans]MCX8148684.1 SDR family NAD(P)-dependent oxidoreductase [Thermaurantimonas aggregans]GCD77148.1 oxidoreductase [Thermaurantimonas aggregans]
MNDYLKGKVLWITGASSGIGKGLALELNKIGGCTLILSARRSELLEELAQQCTQVKAHILPLDLEDYGKASQWTEEALKFAGRIDVLINNAGIGQLGNSLDTLDEVEEKIMRINYFGNVALAKAVVRKMMEQGGGQIVVISSVLGQFSQPRLATYAASKHALYGYYEGFREEVRKKGIKVQIVSPGFINTEVTLNSLKGDGTKLMKNSPAQEKGMRTDVFARKLIKVMQSGREHAYIGGLEIMAAYFKRWFPGLFYWLMRKFVFKT